GNDDGSAAEILQLLQPFRAAQRRVDFVVSMQVKRERFDNAHFVIYAQHDRPSTGAALLLVLHATSLSACSAQRRASPEVNGAFTSRRLASSALSSQVGGAELDTPRLSSSTSVRASIRAARTSNSPNGVSAGLLCSATASMTV